MNETLPLKKLISISKGKKPDVIVTVEEEGYLPYLTAAQLLGNNPKKWAKGGVKSRTTDVLISWDGTVGNVSWELSGIVGSTIGIISPNLEMVDVGFLGRFLRSKKELLNETATGATIKHIRRGVVENLRFPLISVSKQRKIAAILNKTDEIKHSSDQLKKKRNELINSLFEQMFGDPYLNPNSYDVKELQEVVSEGTSVTYGIVQAGPEVENGVPYIRTTDLSDGGIQERHLRRTSPEIASKFERSRVQEGDLVISIRATVGTIAMTPPSLNGANLTQGTARISPGKLVTGEFLLWHIRSHGSQQWISRQVKGATFKEITLTRLRTLPVMIPPIDLQNRFTQYVGVINSVFGKIDISNVLSSKNYKALMQEMFS